MKQSFCFENVDPSNDPLNPKLAAESGRRDDDVKVDLERLKSPDVISSAWQQRVRTHAAHDRKDESHKSRRGRSILNYMGSKSQVARKIIAAFPEHKTFVDVFGGSGCITFTKPHSGIEIYNDFDNETHNLFKIFREQPEVLAALIAAAPRSRKHFNELKHLKPDLLGNVEKAFRTLYLASNGFTCGQRRSQYFPVCRTAKPRWKTFDLTAEIYRWSERFSCITIENLDFANLIDRYDHSDAFFFCDPPYPTLEHYYRTTFKMEDHARLAKSLRNIKGKALLTLPNFPIVLELYQNFTEMRPLSIRYSASGKRTMGDEILIFVNYVPPDSTT